FVSARLSSVASAGARDQRIIAQRDATTALAEADSLEDAGPRVLQAVGAALGWPYGALWITDGGRPTCRAVWGEAIPGGIRHPSPIRYRTDVLGAIEFLAPESHQADDDLLALLETIGLQIGMFIRRTEAEHEARQAVRLREDLLAIVSHDLRNPLGTIMTGAQLLEMRAGKGEEGRKIIDVVQRIQRSGHRMDHLIRDLLDFAHISAGRLSVNKRPHEVEALFGEAYEMLHPLASKKSVS